MYKQKFNVKKPHLVPADELGHVKNAKDMHF